MTACLKRLDIMIVIREFTIIPNKLGLGFPAYYTGLSPGVDITSGRYNVLTRKMAGHMVISQKYNPRRIEFVLFKTKFGKVG